MNSRRRKDFAALLRNIERPSEKGTYMGVASSITGDGKNVNGQNFSEGEVRDLFFALPYGISSSGVDGIKVQIVRNDNQNNVAVGVIDDNKPDVKSGCIIIYDKAYLEYANNPVIDLTTDAKTLYSLLSFSSVFIILSLYQPTKKYSSFFRVIFVEVLLVGLFLEVGSVNLM